MAVCGGGSSGEYTLGSLEVLDSAEEVAEATVRDAEEVMEEVSVEAGAESDAELVATAEDSELSATQDSQLQGDGKQQSDFQEARQAIVDRTGLSSPWRSSLECHH